MENEVLLLVNSMKDLEWLQGNSAEIRKKYEGKIVAIKDRAIVAIAQNSKILLNNLEKNGINPAEVIIERIPEENELIIL